MADGGIVKYSGIVVSPALTVDIDMADKVLDVLKLNDTEYNTTTPCSNDYCVSDEEYLNMIEQYVKPSVFEWILISMYFVVFVSIC